MPGLAMNRAQLLVATMISTLVPFAKYIRHPTSWASTHYLRAVKDPKASKTSRLSTRSFAQEFVADANVYRQQIRVCVALIDAIKSVFIPNYHLLRIGVVLSERLPG